MNTSQVLFPAFQTSPRVIACSSSMQYAPYLSVYIQSIKQHASRKKKYDIVVFETSWTEELRTKFKWAFSANNFSVRFCNPEHFFASINLYTTYNHFAKECYYRLAAPVILRNYDRILFTDIDLVVQDDIDTVFSTDMNGKTVAAAREPVYEQFYLTDAVISTSRIRIRTYTDDILKIKPHEYRNTGVMLVDVKKYNHKNAFNEIISLIKNNHFLYQEQCALNKFFRDDFADIPRKWNYIVFTPDRRAELRDYIIEDIQSDVFKLSLCHYGGLPKPWTSLEMPFSYVWWHYAKNSPFYVEILSNFLANKVSEKLKPQVRSDMDTVLKKQVDVMQNAVTQKIRTDTEKVLKNQVDVMRNAVTQKIQTDMGNVLKKQVDIMRDAVTRKIQADTENALKKQVNMMREVLTLPNLLHKLKRVRLKIHFSFGARKQRYLRRKQELKSKIKAIEKYIKTCLER